MSRRGKLERIQKIPGAEVYRKEKHPQPLKSSSTQSTAHAFLTNNEDEMPEVKRRL